MMTGMPAVAGLAFSAPSTVHPPRPADIASNTTADGRVGACQIQTSRSTRRRQNTVAFFNQDLLEEVARPRFVIHDKNGRHVQRRFQFRRRRARQFGWADSNRQPHSHLGTDSEPALHVDGSSHQLAQLPAYGQAQARPFVLRVLDEST